MHVDELDEARKALLNYAEAFFHEVRNKDDVYARLGLAFTQLREQVVKLATEGHVTPDFAEAWSWYTIAVPAILKVVFLDGAKWGTRELELQLLEAFKATMRKSATTTIKHPTPPTAEASEFPAVLIPHRKPH